jgi:hypothetical protein
MTDAESHSMQLQHAFAISVVNTRSEIGGGKKTVARRLARSVLVSGGGYVNYRQERSSWRVGENN